MCRKWLTIGEAAEYFNLKVKTLYSLVNRGRLPEGGVLRIGRQIRIDVNIIETGMTLKRK
jgi:excisionase family DNA binding protein